MSDEIEIANPPAIAPVPDQHRRDMIIRNVSLTADDLIELFEIVDMKTIDAQKLQIGVENPTLFESEEHLREEVEKYFRVDYTIRDLKGNSVVEADFHNFKNLKFSDDLSSVYISNTTVFGNATNGKNPTNCVQIFLDFERSPIAINQLNSPSNPSENGSCINIFGYDEDWVISTHQKISDFMKRNETNRAILNGSGTYDFYLYFLFFPLALLGLYKIEVSFPGFFKDVSAAAWIAIYVYCIILTIFTAALSFKYFRWLFPTVEYIPRRTKVSPLVHKGFLFAVGSSLVATLIYNVAALIP